MEYAISNRQMENIEFFEEAKSIYAKIRKTTHIKPLVYLMNKGAEV